VLPSAAKVFDMSRNDNPQLQYRHILKVCLLVFTLFISLSVKAQQAPRCGDKVIEPTLGEVCDDGNTSSGDGCRSDCRKTEVCGDGILDAGEACDDGNTLSNDRCPSDCQVQLVIPLVCGNAIIDPGENCDDGNTNSDDSCPSDCFLLTAPALNGKDPRIARRNAVLITSVGSLAVAGSFVGVSVLINAIQNANLSEGEAKQPLVGTAGAAIGASLFGVGLIIGPSAGHLYAGERRHALLSSGARLAFAAISAAGFINGLGTGTNDPNHTTIGQYLSVIGLTGFGGLILADLRDAPRAVKRMAKAH
jgi:cysteine-rich repeat protein